MGTPNAVTRAALCGSVAAFVLAAGLASVAAPAATAGSSVGLPAPGGAVQVQPVGGGGCIIGLNCGCTRNCHKPRPPGVVDNQHAVPAPPSPQRRPAGDFPII